MPGRYPAMMFHRFRSFFILAALTGCMGDMCGNRILRTATSPDGRYTAVTFARDCGATTRASTQVSILTPGEDPPDGGNIFIAEPNSGLDARPGRDGVEVTWLGPTRLRIRYDRSAHVFMRVEAFGDVTVDYAFSEAPN